AGVRCKPNGLRAIDKAFEKTPGEPCSGDSWEGSGCDHQQAMPQQHPPKLDRRPAEGHAYPHFLGPLNDGIRNDTVNANYRQQQRDPCESIDGGPVEFRTSEDFIQPLFHSFHTEYRNLWIYRLDVVADRCQVIFRVAIGA